MVALRPRAAPAPLPQLLERQIGIAIRAYTRRAPVLRSGMTVRALQANDQRLDALMNVSRYYGPVALQAAAEAFEHALRPERGGAAFVWIALAEVQCAAWDERRARIQRLLPEHPVAARDALWFYAAPDSCASLLRDDDPGLRNLGVELAGRLALPVHAPLLYQAAQRGADAEACLLACARMGCLPEGYERPLAAVLQGHDLARQHQALEVLGVQGRPVLQAELQAYIQRITAHDGPNEQSHPTAWAQACDAAMALWAARAPDQALAAVVSGLRVPQDVALRVVAMAGRAEGLLPFLDFVERQDRPVTAAERDVLRLVFGQVPGELRDTLGQPAGRVQALRSLACAVFAANGCAALAPQDFTHWVDPAVRERLWPLAQIRLRSGQSLRAGHPLREAADVGHPLRRWLYVEHAARSAHRLALSHEDRAARQLEAVESLLLLHSLEADDAAP